MIIIIDCKYIQIWLFFTLGIFTIDDSRLVGLDRTLIYALYRWVVSTLRYIQAYTRGRSLAEVVTVLMPYSGRTVN